MSEELSRGKSGQVKWGDVCLTFAGDSFVGDFDCGTKSRPRAKKSRDRVRTPGREAGTKNGLDRGNRLIGDMIFITHCCVEYREIPERNLIQISSC